MSLLLTTNVGNLKPDIVTTELKNEAATEAADDYLLVAAAMVIMDPYEAEALMRFILHE